MSFVHLHNHTHYSLLDGLTRPKEALEIAQAQGAPAMAITDHGVLYGAIEFYKEAKKRDIKPIIGCELYVAPAGRLKQEPGSKINHLTVIAYTNEGYENLMQLVTKAHLEGFYYKPRVDHGLLREFHRGLIALSGCISSEIAEALLIENAPEKAIAMMRLYQDLFGKENFFLEIMDHPEMTEQVVLRQKLVGYARELKVPLIATNDNHYAKQENHDAHDILLCIQTGKTIYESQRMKMEGNYSIRTPQEMLIAFADTPDAVANTLEIASRVNVEIAFGKNLIPMFTPPNRQKPAVYLRSLCEEGLKERYGAKPSQAARERLAYELDVIHTAGFDTYFLIVHDLIAFAKQKGVVVGPGRGSAAGSLVAYCLKITDVDPLKYDLFFERFLNPDRVTMPDIDIDFDDERRGEVLNYVVSKYGRENVAQIITFGTMASRAAVRDVGRAMGYAYGEVDRIAKLVPPPVQGRYTLLALSITEDPELKKAYDEEPRTKQLLDNAITLEGTIRHAGTHACAVVISKEPLSLYTPLQRPTGEDNGIITQYSMKPLEELGLLKMDFLGLRNLTILKQAIEIIEQQTGTRIALDCIPLDDGKTFKLLAAGETTGVFQLESGGMRRYLKELQPTDLNDIIAMVSLYRPGPMPWIPMFIKGKHNLQKVRYLHKSFEPILKETYGVAVYQEQILRLTRDFTGMSLGEVDILRKAVGKKDPVLFAEQREKFIDGAIKNKGHPKQFAEQVFDKVIEPFAAYGFNKSHAACYALIAYQTAYLKANYPTAFMAALMSTDTENTDRIALEVHECARYGITVMPPSVNESYASFTVIDAVKIRFGLKAIKGVGDASIAAIIEAREAGGRFQSVEDFARRVQYTVINKKTLEALAYSGAMDDLAERKVIAASVEEITHFARQQYAIAQGGQMDIFGVTPEVNDEHARLKLKSIAPATRFERLSWEKEFLGLYVSGHPLQGLRNYLKKKAHSINTFDDETVDKTVKVAGLMTHIKKILTRNGAYMAMGIIEDLTGVIPIVLFPRVYQEYAVECTAGHIVTIEGKVGKRGDELQIIVTSIKSISLESLIEHAKAEQLYDEHEEMHNIDAQPSSPYTIHLPMALPTDILQQLKDLLLEHKGDREVIVRIGGDRAARRIKVPFGVNVHEGLKKKIKALVGD